MPNTISNFLVGIGLDTTDFDKGARKVDSGLGSISKSALQLGAVVAGAFGVGQLTMGFADAKDELGKFSQVFGVIPNEVAAIGRALEHEGGSLESFMSQLAGIEQLRASTPQELGALFGSAGIVGVDPRIILDAENATEAYLNLQQVFEGASGKQRLQIAKVFGLDEASIRLLSNYRQRVDDLVDAQRTLRPITAEMTQEAARFNDETQDLLTGIGSIADDISIKLLPPISDAVKGMNEWIKANRSFISSGINKSFDIMGDSTLEISGAVAALMGSGFFAAMAGLAKSVPLIGGGLSVAALAAAKLSLVGAAGLGGYAAGGVINDEVLNEATKEGFGRATARAAAFLGSGEAQAAVEAETGKPWQQLFTFSEFPTLSDDELEAMGRGDIGSRPTQRGPLQSHLRPIHVTLQLDGNVIDQRVINMNEQSNEATLTGLESSTRD